MPAPNRQSIRIGIVVGILTVFVIVYLIAIAADVDTGPALITAILVGLFAGGGLGLLIGGRLSAMQTGGDERRN